MTKQVAYKVLSEFWCWYGNVVKTVSRFTDDEHELAALDEVGEHSVACGCLRRSYRNRKNTSCRRCSPLKQSFTSRLGSSPFKAVFHSFCLPKILNFSYVYSCSESIEVLHCCQFPIEQSVGMEILLILFYYHEKITHQVLLIVGSCSLFQ